MSDEMNHKSAILSIAEMIQSGRNTEIIKREIESTYRSVKENLSIADALIYQVFLDGLNKKVAHIDGKEAEEHIYMRDVSNPQINLFKTLIDHFPILRITQNHANELLCKTMDEGDEILLLDIGIGTGVQVSNILKSLNAKSTNKRRVTVLAVEPFGKALKEAEMLLTGAQYTNLDIQFIPFNAFIDTMNLSDIQRAIPDDIDKFVVNFSYSLHHVKKREDRIRVLQFLHRLQPDRVVISEPDVDHYVSDYVERADNCFEHFSTCFRLINTLPITHMEKQGLKLFFAREIIDIIGNCEEQRVERHMCRELWKELISETGFSLQTKERSGQEAPLHIEYQQKPMASVYVLS